MKKKLLFLFMTGLIVTGFAQKTDFYFVSPSNGARFVNPEQVFLFKSNSEILSVDKSLIELKEEDATIDCDFEIKDEKLLFIRPVTLLLRNKDYTLTLKEGAVHFANKESSAYQLAFSTEKQDNTEMLTEFYKNSVEQTGFSPDEKKTPAKSESKIKENNYPADFPVPQIINRNEPNPMPLLLNIAPFMNQNFSQYIMILDTYGIPLYYRKTNAADFKVLPDGNLAYCNYNFYNAAVNYYIIVDNQLKTIDTIRMGNGYLIDFHDMLVMDNGHFLTMAYDPQIVDMSQIVPGGQTDAVVVGAVLQEVDLEQNVYWQWSSWDHFEITDATYDIDLTAPTVDYVHANAFEFDLDGNILLSSRHMDEITKINYETGDIIWRMGVKAKNNQFSFGDTVGWSHQHDIRVLPNGNMTVYDNGNLHKPFPYSQALEYSVDQENLTAEKVWGYKQDTTVFAFATGTNRRIADDRVLIGWGLGSYPLLVSEVDLDGGKHFDLLGPDSSVIYRAVKQEWNHNVFTFNKDTLDFGEYDNYTPVARTFKVTNQTDDTIKITSSYNQLNYFWMVSQLPQTIAPGEEINIIMNFQPQGTGIFYDVLTLNYDNDDNTERIARQITMTGRTKGFGIDEYLNGKVSVYPNPVTDRLNLNIDINGEKTIEIFNVAGQKVFEMKTGDKKINLDTNRFPTGIYNGLIKSEKGNATFRFVKNK